MNQPIRSRKFLAQFCQTSGNPLHGKNDVRARVSRLSNAGRPNTIIQFVITFIIDALYCPSLFPFSHICDKLFKRVPANVDISRSPSHKVGIVFVKTPGSHISPDTIDSGFAASVSSIGRKEAFPFQATTRLRHASKEISIPCNKYCSAIAPAKTSGSFASVWIDVGRRIFNHKSSGEFPSNDVLFSRHNNVTALFCKWRALGVMSLTFAAILLLASPIVKASCIPPPNTYDFQAENWRTNIVLSGGTLSDNSYRIGTRFMQEITWWGLRDKLLRVNLYMGANTQAMTCPIIWDWTGTAINDDLIAFAAADYSESTGLTGNGSSKYLRVSKSGGLALSAVAVGTNIHLATYVRTGSNAGNNCAGVSDAGTGTTFVLAISNGGNTYVFMGNGTVNAANTNAIGFFLSTRSATTNATTYQNTTNIVTDTTANTVTMPPEAYVVHAYNSGGSILGHTARTLSYYALGTAIPPSLVAPYNIAVQNVQSALGRKVP